MTASLLACLLACLKTLRTDFRVGDASATGLNDFRTLKSLLKQRLEASREPSDILSRRASPLGSLHNPFWRPLGLPGAGF